LTGLLFATVIPSANHSLLAQMAAGLTVAALVAAVFQLVRGLALARVEGRFQASTEAAIWDRLLALPVSYFRRYTAGDLATRAGSISQMRTLLTAAATSALLALISGSLNLVLLFYYSRRLALWSLALLLVPVLVTLLFGWRQLAHSRRWVKANGKVQSWVLQMITGIAKLRVSGAERRLFACWAQRFAAMKEADYRSQRLRAGLTVSNSAYEVLSLLVLFGLAVLWKPDDAPALPLGALLGFISAFTGLTVVVTGAAAALILVLGTVPLFEFARPILQAQPGQLVSSNPGGA
jgi:ATP-binding cassette subfamily C protein